VAGAFAGVIREVGRAEVCVIGAGALNQAIKAAAIARGYLAEQGIDLVCIPSFCEVEIDGDVRTGLQLTVEARDESQIAALADGEREVRLDDTAPTASI
jgi:stage V sporulation protein S